MELGLLIPIISVVMGTMLPVAIVGIIFYFLHRANMEKQKTLRMAIEKSDTLPPELLDRIQDMQRKKAKTPMNDVRVGLIWIAIALGLVVLDFLENDYVLGGLTGIAAIPGFIGLALLILGIIGLNRKTQ